MFVKAKVNQPRTQALVRVSVWCQRGGEPRIPAKTPVSYSLGLFRAW